MCGGLNYTCHSSSSSQPSPNSSVCQLYDEHQRISGLLSSRRLQFFDGSLSMRLSGGEKCGNGHNRSTLINFECDRAVLVGKPRYIEVCVCCLFTFAHVYVHVQYMYCTSNNNVCYVNISLSPLSLLPSSLPPPSLPPFLSPPSLSLSHQEVDCEYSFEWPTLLACPHKELECVADGGRYDLRPLLHYQNWMVTTSGEYNIAVGGCR